MRNLQEHDEQTMRAEREKKKAMQRELKETLRNQIDSKEQRGYVEVHETRNPELRVVDDGFGTNDHSGQRNYDQRPQIALHTEYKVNSTGKERDTDRHLVQALSE